MADIINFGGTAPEPDIYDMSRAELEEYLEAVRGEIDGLDGREPEDMNSEQYEAWARQHEYLEDLADEIMDILDEI